MKLAQNQLQSLLNLAIQAATEAGLYIQSQVSQTNEVQGKTGGDSLASQVVTEVDFQAQEIILNHLKPSLLEFDLGLLTEEAIDDRSRLTKDYFWCIDPMDGTLHFAERRPGYAVSIALISKAGDPVLGVVYVPNEGLCYSAIQGEGVKRSQQPFERTSIPTDHQLHWYMDRSFQGTDHFELVNRKMATYANEQGLDLQIRSAFGAVVNAISVMTSGNACYFKFTKKSNGGGSIWDYAATRLFFQELEIQVTNAHGEKLHLNDPETTFMNHQGISYTTSMELSKFIHDLNYSG